MDLQEPYLVTKLESAERTWKELSVSFRLSAVACNKIDCQF